MSKFTLKGENGSSLSIEILNYENIYADNLDDLNWLNCTLRLDVFGLNLCVSVNLTTQELYLFKKDIKSLLDCKTKIFKFNNLEENFSLNIDASMKTLSGTINNINICNYSVLFKFNTDQSYIQNTFYEIERIVREYPKINT